MQDAETKTEGELLVSGGIDLGQEVEGNGSDFASCCNSNWQLGLGGGVKISNIIKKKKVKWHGEFFVALVDCYSKITPLSLSDLKLSPGFRGI